jgi:hypothetical protein
MKKNKGGSAFPLPMGSETTEGNQGMSLRDWFAGQALAGLIAQCNMPNEVYAKMAYSLADTMLQQRELNES